MRRFLSMVILSACAAAPQTVKAGEPSIAAPPALVPFLPPALAGLTRKSFGQYAPRVFSDIFSAKVAQLYTDCGALAAVEADYDKEHVVLIDAGTAINALCIFGEEKTLDAKPMDEATAPQGEGYRRAGRTFARRGRYYVRVTGSNQSSGGGKSALTLMQAVLDALPNPSTPDPALEQLRALPMIGRIPGSDRYMSSAVFGFASLPRGVSADYGCGESALSIAHLGAPPGMSASQLVDRAHQEAIAQGYTAQPYALTAGAWRFDKPGKPTVYVLSAGTQAAAIEADTALDACAHIPRELLRVLLSQGRPQ